MPAPMILALRSWPPADEVAEQIAADRAAEDAHRGLIDGPLAGVRVGGAGGGGDQRAGDGDDGELTQDTHYNSPVGKGDV